jgi:5-methylcytosine-specific restriction endonuclease McrA
LARVKEIMSYKTSMGSKDRRRRKFTLWEKQRGKCFYCKVDISLSDATLDHKLARSKGGENKLSNLVVACRFCNHEKGDR